MKIGVSDFTLPEAQPFLMEAGEHAVLLMHGFTGSAAHMRIVGEKLHDAGFTVMGINLPGHAKDLEAMRASTWQEWLAAGRNAVNQLREKYRIVSAMGLSMGGCISLILAEEGLVNAVVTVSAPMAVQNPLLPLAKVLAPLFPRVSWGNGGGPKDQMLDPRYNLGYGGFPTKNGADLSKIIKQARANLGRVTCPVLAIQSHDDETIAAGSAQTILNGVSSGVKDMLWLDEVPHVCTITKAAPDIASRAAAFLSAVK